MVSGLIFYTLISLGYAYAPNIYVLILVRLLHGVASTMVAPVAQAYAGDLSPEGKEGTYMNVFMMFMYLGMAAGPFMGGTLNNLYGMNWAFYSMGALSALSLLFLILFVPPIKARFVRTRPGLRSMVALLKDNRIKVSTLHLFSRAILRQGIISFLPLYAVQVLGMKTTVIGEILSIYIFVEAVSQGVMGPITDRMNRYLLLVGGTLVAAILSFFIGNMHTEGTLLLILIPVALMTSLARAAASAYHLQVGHELDATGASMGILNSSQNMGSAVGPILFGVVTDSYGLQSMFLTGGIAGIVAIPLMVYYALKKQQRSAVTETR
jgi:DHA1 family multidrug resistance protein-like MFS transporter